jgi:hypothetical protein
MNRGRRHFPGAVSTPHHAPLGEPSVALVAQKTRCGRAGGAEPYRHPVCRADDRGRRRRVGTLTHLYRHASRTAHDGHTGDIAVPPTRRGQGRAVPSPGLPCRRPGQEAARRNPARAVPDRHLYRPRPAYSRGTRTPYAPGAPGEPGRTAGNAEQSAPAARSVAIARRASATESGSAASYTTPQTTRRPRLAWTNHRRRSAHGTIVTRQPRMLTCHLPAQVSGRRAPGATTPGTT